MNKSISPWLPALLVGSLSALTLGCLPTASDVANNTGATPTQGDLTIWPQLDIAVKPDPVI